MNKCKKCGIDMPNWLTINGKKHNIHRRKFCLVCSPFQKHNTCQYIAKQGYKYCTKCKKELPLSNFSKKTETRINSWCKKCLYILQSQRDHKRKELAVKYKGGKCKKCGYNKYMGALEFHHKDPLIKDANFQKLRKRKWEEYRAELDKCELLCANCHAEVHGEIEKDIVS